MIVVDTNIICFLYLNGIYTGEAEQAFDRDPYWIAPLLWRSEFRNVLAGYIRKGVLTFSDATRSWIGRCNTCVAESMRSIHSGF